MFEMKKSDVIVRTSRSTRRQRVSRAKISQHCVETVRGTAIADSAETAAVVIPARANNAGVAAPVNRGTTDTFVYIG
jgi:hypothetical protein